MAPVLRTFGRPSTRDRLVGWWRESGRRALLVGLVVVLFVVGLSTAEWVVEWVCADGWRWLGAVVVLTAVVVVIVSAHEFRLRADRTPLAMPMTISITIAQKASRRLSGARSLRIEVTLSLVRYECPRSPWASRFMYLPYWT